MAAIQTLVLPSPHNYIAN